MKHYHIVFYINGSRRIDSVPFNTWTEAERARTELFAPDENAFIKEFPCNCNL